MRISTLALAIAAQAIVTVSAARADVIEVT